MECQWGSLAATDFDGSEGIHFNNCECKGCDGHYVRARTHTHATRVRTCTPTHLFTQTIANPQVCGKGSSNSEGHLESTQATPGEYPFAHAHPVRFGTAHAMQQTCRPAHVRIIICAVPDGNSPVTASPTDHADYDANPVWGCAAACYNNETTNRPQHDVKTAHTLYDGDGTPNYSPNGEKYGIHDDAGLTVKRKPSEVHTGTPQRHANQPFRF